jgi:mannosyltransferase OCH1-like enzyme
MSLDFSKLDSLLLSKKGRIINQVWFGTIPNKREAKKAYNKLSIYRDSWTAKNPDWYRVEWNKETSHALVKLCYSEYLELYEGYPYEIQRCDFIRYLILHRYGGWYVDMDYYCNRPLDEVHASFKNPIYFVQTPNRFTVEREHISNSLMYSVPNYPFWKKLVLELELGKNSPYYYTKHLAVMYSTGPGILNRLYFRYKFKYRLKSLPYKLFHPYGIKDTKLSLKKDTSIYAIHIGKGSWEEEDSKFILFLARNWMLVIFCVVVLIIPILRR